MALLCVRVWCGGSVVHPRGGESCVVRCVRVPAHFFHIENSTHAKHNPRCNVLIRSMHALSMIDVVGNLFHHVIKLSSHRRIYSASLRAGMSEGCHCSSYLIDLRSLILTEREREIERESVLTLFDKSERKR